MLWQPTRGILQPNQHWRRPQNAGGGGVAFDAISNSTPISASGSNPSWTHTPIGVPTAVAVMVGGYFNNCTITGVTYGGVSMSAGTLFGNSTDLSTQMFGLANPPSGPQTVAVTFSPTGDEYAAAAAVTVTGSDPVTCFSNSSGNALNPSSSISDTVTSAVGELVIDCVAGWVAGAGASGVGGAQTSRYSAFWNGNLSFGVSTAAGAASVTTTWSTVSSSDHAAGAIASFKAP
jgi:hypothetical protein